MSWAGIADDIRHDREVQGVVDAYSETIDKWKVYSNDLSRSLEQKERDYDALSKAAAALHTQFLKLVEDNKELAAMVTAQAEKASLEGAKVTNTQSALNRTKTELEELEKTNVMNYAEKKAYMAYARDLRNASNVEDVFDPILYSGDKGNFIRERIRKAALRVFNAGGSVQSAADAGVREMRQHVAFTPPSPDRLAKIRRDQWEVVARANGNPEILDSMDPEDAQAAADNCLDIKPA